MTKAKRYFNAILEAEVVEALKITAVRRGKSGSEIIQELLEKELKEEIQSAIAS
jgi:hypothetical protein